MKIIRMILWGAAVLCTALLGFLYWQGLSPSQTQQMTLGGEFTLPATTGATITRKQLQGKPYAIFFGFTRCPEVCPTTLFTLTAAYEDLGDAARDFNVYFISVDPERDTLEYMRDYLTNFDPRIVGLVPSVAQLAEIARSFHILYEKVPTSDGSYTMNHTASVFLFRADGSFAGTIAYGEEKGTRVAKLRRLLGG
ncbi:MAG: SCO family protein [Proteobacteria bacterium]|nr:SCO family protein [Pseudomonadota bacterium]